MKCFNIPGTSEKSIGFVSPVSFWYFVGISINPLQDVSFKQATLVALADAPSTRWITFTQPGGLGAAGVAEAVEDDKGAVIAEIRLSRRNWGGLSWLDNWFFKPRR